MGKSTSKNAANESSLYQAQKIFAQDDLPPTYLRPHYLMMTDPVGILAAHARCARLLIAY